MIKITFPDGNVREYAAGTTALDVAKSISEGLARNVLAAGVNGEVRDLLRPINEDASILFYKWDDKEGKSTFWHSSAHLLAEALEALFPGLPAATAQRRTARLVLGNASLRGTPDDGAIS